jgi:hypothetical protein
MSLPGPIIPPITPHEHYGTGRLPSTDLRDHLHLTRRLLTRKPRSVRKIWPVPLVLDQGSTPACTGFSAKGLLLAGPVVNDAEHPDGMELYAAAQANDEWPGNDYEGSSVRGAMKALQAMGFLSAYAWAFTVADAADWIIAKGPMGFGTLWTDSMFDPVPFRKHQFVRLDVSQLPKGGGHAYLVNGADKSRLCPDGSKGAFLIHNSWGVGWGENGRAWISFRDMDVLMKEDGEACTPTEIVKAAELRQEDIVE